MDLGFYALLIASSHNFFAKARIATCLFAESTHAPRLGIWITAFASCLSDTEPALWKLEHRLDVLLTEHSQKSVIDEIASD